MHLPRRESRARRDLPHRQRLPQRRDALVAVVPPVPFAHPPGVGHLAVRMRARGVARRLRQQPRRPLPVTPYSPAERATFRVAVTNDGIEEILA